MSNKLLFLIKKSILYSLSGALLQVFVLSTLNASSGEAQDVKSVKEFYINIEFENLNAIEAFKLIESKSNYRFAYERKYIDPSIKLNFRARNKSLADVLTEISKLTNLKFRQINNDIDVKLIQNHEKKKVDRVEILNQTRNVSGTVISADEGGSLPGVNVVEAGTNNGTVTDVNGEYSLEVSDGATLVFSSVGYATQEIPIGNRSVIDVTMRPDIKQLQELVVTALGIERETKSLGYATHQVEQDEVTVNRTPNFMNALQGKVPGVNISPMATGAGGTSKIRIRGQSSFQANNSPLIVVNGVPIDNSNFGVGSGGQGINDSDGGDGLLSINPDDIESMNVLKGATAAALYGARAKDGVILITTKKRGDDQGLSVSWNSNFTTDIPINDLDYQLEYGQGEGGVRPTSPNPVSGVWSFGEKFEPGMTQVLFDGVEVPYVPVENRIREFFNNGKTWVNTLTLATNSEKGGVNVSLSYLDNEGIVPFSEYNKYNLNLGFTQNLTEKLSATGSINYSREIHKNPPQTAAQSLTLVTGLYTMSNSMPLDVLRDNRYDENGNEAVWSRFRGRINPYFYLYEHFNNVQRDRVFGNLSLRYNLTDWLYAQARVGQDYFTRNQDYNTPTGIAFLSPAPEGFSNGTYTQEVRKVRELNADFLIGASREFGKVGFNLTLGGNQMYRSFDRNSVFVRDFAVRDLYTIMNGREKDPIYDYEERQINSLYGALDLSYNDYLFLSVTARNDWFSTLAPANRSILYPSVSGSFVFSEALADSPGWLTFGKVRAAYAEVGSDLDIGAFSQDLFYNINNNLFPGPDGAGQTVGGINTGRIPNINLKPMRISEYEFGVDLRLFDRINLDLTYYNKLTSDQILAAQISNASGYGSQLINVGESVNRGFEMLLGLDLIQSQNFRWNLNYNGSYNTSEVLSLGPNTDQISVGSGGFNGGGGNGIRHVVGLPLGQIYTNAYLRDDQGRIIFNENNGFPMATTEPVSFGTAIPVWVGGITNEFFYNDFSFSFLIDYKLGHKLMSGTNFNAWRHGHHKGTLPGREEGFVIGDGVNPNGEINTTQAPVQPFYETVGAQRRREDFVYNAGFWKLRQVTLSYNFSKLLPENLFVKELTLSAVGNHVFVFRKWTENIDPEQGVYTSDNQVGLESNGLPMTRSLGFNLNVKF